MTKVQPLVAERLRDDILPVFIAFRNGHIPPYVFNFLVRLLKRKKSDSDVKLWYKVCWIVLTVNLETYQLQI
jgi:hypothetical protein